MFLIGEDKVSGDETEIAETLSIAVQDSAEQNTQTSLSPHSYSFKRPDGAEKRKGYFKC